MHAFASKRVLVTGATGFIGLHLVRRLIGEGSDVTCLVRATSQVVALREIGAALTTCDLGDCESIMRAMREARSHVVFHVAGLVRSVNRGQFSKVNADMVAAVASACEACDPPPVLVLVSSLAAAGPSAGERAKNEESESRPVSAYGRSKLAGERAAMQFADRISLTIVRPPIVFGPADHGVLQMMRPIARLGVHIVPGGGEFRLSVVYVDDLIDGLLRAAMNGERCGSSGVTGQGLYFLAADEHPTYVEFGRMIGEATGRQHVRMARVPPPLLRTAGRMGDLIGRLRRRPAWVNSDKVAEALAGSWICCSSKAREQLHWRPAAPILDRLRETAEAHRRAGLL